MSLRSVDLPTHSAVILFKDSYCSLMIAQPLFDYASRLIAAAEPDNLGPQLSQFSWANRIGTHYSRLLVSAHCVHLYCGWSNFTSDSIGPQYLCSPKLIKAR